MNYYKYFIKFLIILLSFIFPNKNNIITIGGSVTEVVFSLGYGENVIAVDQSSTLPADQVKNLPQVGYVRSLSAEGILSLKPSIILASSDIGPKNVINQIENASVPIHIFDSPKDFNGIISLIKDIADTLNVDKPKDVLINNLNKKKKELDDLIQNTNMKIAFFMNAGNSNSLNAAGNNTKANYLIELIGGQNIFKDSFNRYSKVSNESLLKLNPDIILIGSMSNDDLLKSEITNNSNLNSINAIKNNQVFVIDLGYHLTFGTNLVDAALNLSKNINKK